MRRFLNTKGLYISIGILLCVLSAQTVYADVIGPEVYWVLGAWALIALGLFIGGIVLIASIVTWGLKKIFPHRIDVKDERFLRRDRDRNNFFNEHP